MESNHDGDVYPHMCATSALPDFQPDPNGEGWIWRRSPRTQFRIPQYEGTVFPFLDLPVAPDFVFRELLPRELEPEPMMDDVDVREEEEDEETLLSLVVPREKSTKVSPTRKRSRASVSRLSNGKSDYHQRLSFGFDTSYRVEKDEISVEELKKRLSQLIGV